MNNHNGISRGLGCVPRPLAAYFSNASPYHIPAKKPSPFHCMRPPCHCECSEAIYTTLEYKSSQSYQFGFSFCTHAFKKKIATSLTLLAMTITRVLRQFYCVIASAAKQSSPFLIAMKWICGCSGMRRRAARYDKSRAFLILYTNSLLFSVNMGIRYI